MEISVQTARQGKKKLATGKALGNPTLRKMSDGSRLTSNVSKGVTPKAAAATTAGTAPELRMMEPEPISLVDCTDIKHDQNLWAKEVSVDGYEIVKGTGPVGAYAAWQISVVTTSNSTIRFHKRYSEFDEFRAQLIRAFPTHEREIPQLPAKSIVARFSDQFMEERRAGLEYFAMCVFLNPVFASSKTVQRFMKR